MRCLFLTTLCSLFCVLINAQVAINTDGSQPNTKSVLDVKSSSKGVLLPRMSSAQRKAMPVTSADAGMIVFDLDQQTIYIFDGQYWRPMVINSEKNYPPVNRTAIGGDHSERFGHTVDVKGDYAIVGAPHADVGSHQIQGVAYIFYRSPQGWVQQAMLTANDGDNFHYFGTAVAIDGNYAAVSNNTGGGAVYIFERNGNTWTQQFKITVGDAIPGDDFGAAIAMSNEKIIIGAPSDDVGLNQEQGSAYVFRRNGATWVLETKLAGLSGASGDMFGYSVDIQGDYCIVGVPNDDIGLNEDQGSAYVYVYGGGTWTLQTKLIYSNGKFHERFGYCVGINQQGAIISAPWAAENYAGQGVIYLYARNGSVWSYTQRIIETTPGVNELFGLWFAFGDGYLLVGKTSADESRGCVYAYTVSDMFASYYRKITDMDGSKSDQFGRRVAIDGQRYIIGAPFKNGGTGSVSFGVLE